MNAMGVFGRPLLIVVVLFFCGARSSALPTECRSFGLGVGAKTVWEWTKAGADHQSSCPSNHYQRIPATTVGRLISNSP